MTRRDSTILFFVRELRRRRVFRTAAIYIVGAWLVMQAADVFFPAWGIPEAALNVLLAAAFLWRCFSAGFTKSRRKASFAHHPQTGRLSMPVRR
jgi:hypothetical protein